MTLYEIDKRIESLFEVDPETGEVTFSEEAYEELALERDAKIENIALFLKNLTAESKAIKEEERMLAERRKRQEVKAERLRAVLTEALDGQKFSTSRVAITWRRSEKVILNEDVFMSCSNNLSIPEAVTFKPSISKAAIKKYMKKGFAVPGAELVQSQSMTIQ